MLRPIRSIATLATALLSLGLLVAGGPATPIANAGRASAASGPALDASQGQTDVSLSIAGGSNILGADLTLSYDPSAFTIKDVHEGGYLSGTSNQVIALVHNIDNQKGIAKVTLERQPTAGLASGDGTLMKITLQPGAKIEWDIKTPASEAVILRHVADCRRRNLPAFDADRPTLQIGRAHV